MYTPFLVFGLPRSRTFWLTQWLGVPGAPVGHDLGTQVDSISALVDRMWNMAGTVETGMMHWHRLVRHCFPEAKFVTIRRDRDEVLDSLAKFQILGQEAEMEARDQRLDEIEALGAERVPFSALGDVNCCAWLWEHLLGIPFDFNRWQQFDRTNLQVNMAERLGVLAQRQDSIQRLMAEASGMESELVSSPVGKPWTLRVGPEAWGSMWPEVQALGLMHYLEANGGERLGHPFKIHETGMRQLEACGALRIISARVNGRLAGYISWTLGPDLESEGIVLADQGPIYILPEFASLRLGQRLYRESLVMLRNLGVHTAYPHHPMNGRGAKLGVLFSRLGATPMYQKYAINLGDLADA